MNTSQTPLRVISPVLFSFFIMGFCDIIGKASDYIKTDFNLSDSITGFLPAMVFIWFLFLSIPTGALMNKIGRKNTVLLSMSITVLGMMLPLLNYSFYSCLAAFALIGMGNAIIQVSLNPLISNLVDSKRMSSALSAGQVIKTLSSLFGPYILSLAYMEYAQKWYYALPMLGVLTLLAMLWLYFTNIPKEKTSTQTVSFKAVFALLSNSNLLLLFFGVLFVVGLDVGINYIGSKLLIGRCGAATTTSLAQMVYFSSKLVGTFVGAFLLTKINDRNYFKMSVLVAFLSVLALLFVVNNEFLIIALIGLVGFSSACIFPIIYTQAVKIRPDKTNEISGLMITGISGGALIPPVMGVFTTMTDSVGFYSQTGGLLALLLCLVYLLYLAFIKTAKL